MRKLKLALAIACTLGAVLASSNNALAAAVVAVNQSNQIFYFDSSTPNTTSSAVAITGLTSGDTLTGIDSRPSNGMVYGFAQNGTVGRVYTINPITGAATLASTLNTGLDGSSFGVDFNPVADRLRVVSDTGQNLRINVDTGATTVDMALNYAAGDPNAGVMPNVIAGAYTNSVQGAATTTLYDIDIATQSLVTQLPPNNGTLNTVANLGAIAFAETSFDIDGLTGMGYIVTNGFEFSSINLTNGSVDFIGAINSGSNVIGFTTVAAVPEPTSVVLLAGTVGAYFWRQRRVRKQTAETELSV